MQQLAAIDWKWSLAVLLKVVERLVIRTSQEMAVCSLAGMVKVMPGSKLCNAFAMQCAILCRTGCNECKCKFIALSGMYWLTIVVYHMGGHSLAAPFAGRVGLTSLDGS